MSGVHKIVEARVINWRDGAFGVLYRYDSGWLDAHRVGTRQAAERAAQRLGESEPIPGYQPRTRPPARHALLKNAN
jgi:hypothetical protein